MLKMNQFINYCGILKDDLESLVSDEYRAVLSDVDKVECENTLKNDILVFIKDSAGTIYRDDSDEYKLFIKVFISVQKIIKILSMIDFCSEQLLDPEKCLIHPDNWDILPETIMNYKKQLDECYKNTYEQLSTVISYSSNANRREIS